MINSYATAPVVVVRCFSRLQTRSSQVMLKGKGEDFVEKLMSLNGFKSMTNFIADLFQQKDVWR